MHRQQRFLCLLHALMLSMMARCVVFLGAIVMAAAAQAAGPHLDLDVRLDPVRRNLQASGSLALPPGETLRLHLWGTAEVASFMLDGRALPAARATTAGAAMWRWDVRAAATGSRLTFAYTLPLQALDSSLDHREVLGLNAPVAGAEGVFLPAGSAWYPQPQVQPTTHRIAIDVVGTMRALVPGSPIEETEAGAVHRAVFESPVSLPGIDLIAGPYAVSERQVVLDKTRSVRLRTYFHGELQELADAYLDSATRYLVRYDRSFGAYRYPAYSIVSAPIPTGFGMPGIAYLGRQVIRLPFIRATSLGHEVLHDWWGNGVYPDYAQGNWSEGLTTFLADYAFREDEGAEAAKLQREAWLRDYAAVPAGQDRALSAFISRRHGADQAVGYSKTAFVFFMLRDWIGEDAFRAGLRAFWKRHAGRAASWQDLQQAFEATSGRDLGEFFRQWVTRAGAPSIGVASARRMRDGSAGERLQIVLMQETDYRLRVPVRIALADGRAVDATIDVAGAEGRTEIALPARAIAVAIDPDARMFRRVSPQETAPILRQVMLDPRTRVVTGADRDVGKAALVVAQAVLEQRARTIDPAAAASAAEPLFVAARASEVAELVKLVGLPSIPEALSKSGAAYAYAGRTSNGRNFIVVSAPDATSMEAVARPLPHLGGQSYAVFDGVRSVDRGVWPANVRRVPVE